MELTLKQQLVLSATRLSKDNITNQQQFAA
jgi:hypothetical protein